jgi:hypothetical protein
VSGNLFKLIERNARRNLRLTVFTTLTLALATFIFTTGFHTCVDGSHH